MSQAAKAPKTETTVSPAAPAAPASAPAQVFPFPGFDLSKFDLSKFDLPKFEAFDLSKLEIPAPVRESAEQVVVQLKEGYAKLKAAAEEATDLIEDTYATASNGVKDLNLKALEATRSNVNASLDHARDLMGVKTLAEAIDLQSTYLRKQFEVLQAQFKDYSTLAQKLATETVEPVKEKVEKAFKTAAK